MKTGAYALFNAVLKDAVRFDIRTGYGFDKGKSDANGREFETHEVIATPYLEWNSNKVWTGTVSAFAGVKFEKPDATKYIKLGGAADVKVRVANFSQFEFAMGLDAKVDYDPFREVLGLMETNATGMFMMDLSWVPLKKSPDNSTLP